MRRKTFVSFNLIVKIAPLFQSLRREVVCRIDGSDKGDAVITRRRMFQFGLAAGLLTAGQTNAAPALLQAQMRGTINGKDANLIPQTGKNRAPELLALIDAAREDDQWVFLPPGRYEIAGLELPDRTRLAGVAGATTLVFSGGDRFVQAQGKNRIELTNIVFDGADRPLPASAPALLSIFDTVNLTIENCEFRRCAKTAIQAERCAGRIEQCQVSGVGEYAVYAIDSEGLAIVDNRIDRCGNGGILVHRRNKGEDSSIVTGNRITNTGASYGGTGQFGNAVNIYRADGVIVSGNHILNSAFSAIRANAASNVQISGNQCISSGETAIYSEFGFEGALVQGNLVDKAANGISIANFNEGGRLAVVANNIVRNISLSGPYIHDSVGFGIGIGVEADTVVSNNVIENVPRWGMLVGWGPYLRNVVITANIIRKARIGCAVSVAEEPEGALINGNLFDETPDGAIIGFLWHDAVTGELATGGGQFSHLTIEGNRLT